MLNSGYVGYKRSVRSDAAIREFEVPISLITKSLIQNYIEEIEDFTELEKKTLDKFTVAQWKYGAKIVGAASWHHTSTYFNKTEHYCLSEIAKRILDDPHDFEESYIESKKKSSPQYKYAIISVQVWGGSRNYPKLTGYDTQPGIVVGDWFYYRQTPTKIGRYKVAANKTEWMKQFDSFKEMVSEFPEYGAQEPVIDIIINEKGLNH